MLMKPDKKKNMASLILGSSSPMDEMKSSNEKMSEEPEMDEGLLAAADEMMAALEAKDVKALAQAMQSFIDMASASTAMPE